MVLWLGAGDSKTQYPSPHGGPWRYWAPLHSLWNLFSGDWQTIQRTALCKWLHCWGQIEKQIEKQGETKRSNSVVWGGQEWIKGLGADLRPLSVRQSWLHLTSLWRSAKPTGISSYTVAMPYRDISVPPPQPFHLGQYCRWKWMGGVGLCIASTCRGWTTKGVEPFSPDARQPSLTLLYGIHMALLLPYQSSTGRRQAWGEPEQRGTLSRSPGDGKSQLCGKQKWT